MAADVKWTTLLLIAPLMVAPASIGYSAELSPELVKVSYILNLQRYVKVGDSQHAPKTVCYYEKHGVPIDKSVGQLLDKYLHDHPNEYREMAVKKFEAIRDFSGCDIFYIPAEQESDIENILSTLGDSSTLTISAANRFIVRGGIIGLVLDEENRIRLAGNLRNAKAKNVYLDPQLLEIMKQVIMD